MGVTLSDTFSFDKDILKRLEDEDIHQDVPSQRTNKTKAIQSSTIYVNCDISETIAKYISAFLGTRITEKEVEIIINKIVIDCHYDCSKIIEIFEAERISKIRMIEKRSINIELLDYDFRGHWLIDFLNSLIESSPVGSVLFDLRNQLVIEKGDPIVILALLNLSENSIMPTIQVCCREGYDYAYRANRPYSFKTFYERNILY